MEDCHGLRLQTSALSPTGQAVVAEVRVLADRGILFIFGLRRPADVADELAPAFEVMIDGVRLSVARD